MSKARILVVEDEADVRELILLHLRREGFEAVGVEEGEIALQVLSPQNQAPFDVAILDWMLPGKSGVEITKTIRTEYKKNIPILILTARAHTTDIILGLEAGADDYLTKPFEIPVLIARVRALLRRQGSKDDNLSGLKVIKKSDFEVDLDQHRVLVGGKEVHLTVSEFKLLSALLSHSGKVLSRDKLIELVQGEGVVVIDRAIDTHIFGLRKKLGKSGQQIETVRGVGYKVS